MPKDTITLKDVLAVIKVDLWTTRFFFDPLAIPLTAWLAGRKRVTPNGITAAALMVGLIAGVLFGLGHFRLGALGYYLYFLLDCVDGKLARVTRRDSAWGAIYDFVVDRTVAAGMSFGLILSLLRHDRVLPAVLVGAYIILFLWKDALTLQLQTIRTPVKLEGGPARRGFLVVPPLKIHFRPGQILSCFAAFFIAPLTHHWTIYLPVAILCVLFSIGYNVVLPLWTRR